MRSMDHVNQYHSNQPLTHDTELGIIHSMSRKDFLLALVGGATTLAAAAGVGHLVISADLENDALHTINLHNGALRVNVHKDTFYNGHLHSVELDFEKNGNFQIALIHKTQELGPKDVRLLDLNVSVMGGQITGHAKIFNNGQVEQRPLHNLHDVNLAVMDRINPLVKSTWGCLASSVALEANFQDPHSQASKDERILLSQ